MPCGKCCIAGDLGFRIEYGPGGYYGYAEIGEGQEMLGIPGTPGCRSPREPRGLGTRPFDPVERDGMLYGRGSQDDKGPMLASLFAVKALMDAGVKFKKTGSLHFWDR